MSSNLELVLNMNMPKLFVIIKQFGNSSLVVFFLFIIFWCVLFSFTYFLLSPTSQLPPTSPPHTYFPPPAYFPPPSQLPPTSPPHTHLLPTSDLPPILPTPSPPGDPSGFRGRVGGMGTLDQQVWGSDPDAPLISKGCVEPLK